MRTLQIPDLIDERNNSKRFNDVISLHKKYLDFINNTQAEISISDNGKKVINATVHVRSASNKPSKTTLFFETYYLLRNYLSADYRLTIEL